MQKEKVELVCKCIVCGETNHSEGVFCKKCGIVLVSEEVLCSECMNIIKEFDEKCYVCQKGIELTKPPDVDIDHIDKEAIEENKILILGTHDERIAEKSEKVVSLQKRF